MPSDELTPLIEFLDGSCRAVDSRARICVGAANSCAAGSFTMVDAGPVIEERSSEEQPVVFIDELG